MNILEVKNIVKIYGEQGGEEATTALKCKFNNKKR